MTDPYLYDITIFCNGLKSEEISPRNRLMIASIIRAWLKDSQANVMCEYFPRSDYMASRYVGKQFSTLTLDVGHEKAFRDWVVKSDINLPDAMGQILEAGYKLSVSWIDDQVSFCVSLIGTDTTKVNKDSIMTSWSSDLEEAILLSVFKHFIMCDGGEWPLRSEGGRWG